jgi:hypothetical protein
MPPRTNPTPYNQGTTDYNEIQGLREDSYAINKLFDKYENIKYIFPSFSIFVANTQFIDVRSGPRNLECFLAPKNSTKQKQPP